MKNTIILPIICLMLLTCAASGVGQSIESTNTDESINVNNLKKQLEALKDEHQLKLKELEELITDIKTKIEVKV